MNEHGSIEPISQQDEYHTPEGKRLCILRKMYFPTSVSFYLQILSTVVGTWNYIRKGIFNNILWCRQSREIIEAIESNGGIIHIRGLHNIRKTEGPTVFISNHMSTLETFVFPSLILPFKDLTYIVKESLLTYPFLGLILRTLTPIAVTRQNPREDLKTVFQKGAEILNSGRSLVIFPQSTRTLQIDPAHFNSLGIKLASRVGVPVIPVAVKTDFWGTGKFVRDIGPIDKSREVFISFGESMLIQGNGKEEHQKIIHFITSHLTQ